MLKGYKDSNFGNISEGLIKGFSARNYWGILYFQTVVYTMYNKDRIQNSNYKLLNVIQWLTNFTLYD